MAVVEANRISPKNSTTRAVLATVIGNALEWYDFIIYGFFALAISSHFFGGSPDETLLATYATFALSFIVRPIGGILLGMLGDRVGRRFTMLLIMASMTMSMLLMVATPTYKAIGFVATLVVIVARLLQSVSAGGEFSSAATYLLESVPAERRGFFSGLYSAGTQIATILAALSGLFISYVLSDASRDSWGWRIPFAVGLLIAPVGLYIRRHLPETEAFSKSQASRVKGGFKTLFERPGTLVLALLLAGAINSGAYILLAYAPTYVVKVLDLPMYVYFSALLVSGGIGAIATPLFGALADRVGAYRQLLVALFIMVVTVAPLYSWMNTEPTMTKLLLCSGFFSIIYAASVAVVPNVMAYLFPAELRAAGMALTYNVSAAIFGGASLYFVTLLIGVFRTPLVPAFYVLTVFASTFLAVLIGHSRIGRFRA